MSMAAECNHCLTPCVSVCVCVCVRMQNVSSPHWTDLEVKLDFEVDRPMVIEEKGLNLN